MEGLWTIKEYIQRRYATIAVHIVNFPIYKLCTGVENISGYSRFMIWWYQYVVKEVE